MRRNNVRLKTFDYRSPGIYLITLVTDFRARILSHITERGICLSRFGMVTAHHIEDLPFHRPQVSVIDDAIMPDHVHLLIHQRLPVPGGLGGVIRSLKAGIAREINILRGTEGAPVWQRNYWERIIRSDADLARYRRYLEENPRRWFIQNGPG